MKRKLRQGLHKGDPGEREPFHQSSTIILQHTLRAQRVSENVYFLCKITEGGKLAVWVQNDLRVQF